MRRKKIIARKSPKIVADAQVVNEAYLNRYVLPQLVNEYTNDNEDFLGILPKVPKAAVGKEGVYKNRLIDNTEAVINNTTDFGNPPANDKEHLFVPWDSVDTKPSKVTRSELRGLPYDIKARLRVNHMKRIKRLTRDFLLQKIAPTTDTTDTPIVTLSAGMTYAKLLDMVTAFKKNSVDPRDCMLILSPDHVRDLAKEQGAGERFRQVFFDEVQGKIKSFLGIGHIFEHGSTPMYNASGVLKPFQATVAATDKQSSLLVNVDEILFHRENMEIYFKPKSEDTRSANPGDEFRLGGYFAADTLVKKGFAAFI